MLSRTVGPRPKAARALGLLLGRPLLMLGLLLLLLGRGLAVATEAEEGRTLVCRFTNS